jgi:hypothetical protein
MYQKLQIVSIEVWLQLLVNTASPFLKPETL